MVLLLLPGNTTITRSRTSRGIFVGCQNQNQNQNQNQRQLVVVAAAININKHKKQDTTTTTTSSSSSSSSFILHQVWWTTAIAAAVVLLSPVVVMAAILQQSEDTLSNIPQMLSSRDSNNKLSRIQRPKSRKAESCTIKCVGTCIRGGYGEGPLNIRRPLVVFKQGFRSRQYCLVECSDICNLIRDGDDGP